MLNIDIDLSGLDDEVNRLIEDEKRRAILELSRIGELYIAEARTNKTYSDISGNLRNANSYRIYLDGQPVTESIGLPETSAMFDQVKSNTPGLELIVGNGMEYATYVEGKGFNVCSSGFLKVEREILKRFIK